MSTPTPSFIPSGPLVHVPVPPASPRKRHPVRNTILAILLLSILGTVSLVVFEPRLNSFVQRVIAQQFLSPELKQALYLSDTATTTRSVRMQGPTTFMFESLPGKLVSLDNRATYAVLLKNGSQYDVRTAKGTVYRDAGPLVGLSRSPNGRYVAVSRFASTTSETDGFVRAQLVVVDTQTFTEKQIGEGGMPLFTDDSHLIYVDALGITEADLTQGTSTLRYPYATASAVRTVVSSPNRTHIALVDPTEHGVVVFTIVGGAIEKRTTLPITPEDISYALGNEGVYVLRTEAAGVAVWYAPFGGSATRTLPLPAQLGITRIGIGSI